MATDYVFVIYTCKQNFEKANQMYDFYFSNRDVLRSLNMDVLIMYGDKSIQNEYEVKDKYLILNVEDDYDNLHLKTMKLIKAINSLYPKIIGCFKCDDDIVINMEVLIYFVKTFNFSNKFDYCGYACIKKETNNNNIHLIEKGIRKENIKTPTTSYCSGPLYYLSNKAINYVSQTDFETVKHIFYEDMMVGYILNKYQIFPTHSFIYSDKLHAFDDFCFHNTDKKKNLFIRIHGGIGNQMFQISAGFGLATEYNMNYFIVNSSSIKTSFTHIEDNNVLFDSIFRHFNKINLEYINLNSISHYVEPESECFTYNRNLILGESDIYLNGYFQNEKYFEPFKQSLIDAFTNNDIYKNFKASINVNFVKNSYFIHVRRGDYLNTKLYDIDFKKYYKFAIKEVLKKDPNAYFFIVSDDVPFCSSYNGFANIQKTVVDLSALETLYLMSLCEKGGICANSTFSWWGAYLNTNPNKLVIFPKQWINKPWQNDIYSKGSIVI
jgi:hypothetical protein